MKPSRATENFPRHDKRRTSDHYRSVEIDFSFDLRLETTNDGTIWIVNNFRKRNSSATMVHYLEIIDTYPEDECSQYTFLQGFVRFISYAFLYKNFVPLVVYVVLYSIRFDTNIRFCPQGKYQKAYAFFSKKRFGTR